MEYRPNRKISAVMEFEAPRASDFDFEDREFESNPCIQGQGRSWLVSKPFRVADSFKAFREINADDRDGVDPGVL